MLTEDTRISLADLAAAGIRLRPVDAVTIAREMILQVAGGEVPGVPSAHVIRLCRSGSLAVEGPVAAGGREVSRAAQLLESLLPPKDLGAEFKVPGALRLCIVRAMGMLDVPPYPSLDSFADALRRFAAPDAGTAIRALVDGWAAAAAPGPAEAPAVQTAVAAPPLSKAAADEPRHPDHPLSAAGSETGRVDTVRADAVREETVRPETARPESGRHESGRHESGRHESVRHEPVRREALMRTPPEALTVSDIRRARRATGLPLNEIAAQTRIPVPLLRQLEWGYLQNWPGGLHGRTQLVRYARAAGLDEQIVIATVWPMLDEVERQRLEVVAGSGAALAPAAESVDIDLAQMPLVRAAEAERARSGAGRRFLRRAGAAALAVAAATVAFLAVPMVREQVVPLQREAPVVGTSADDRTTAQPTIMGSTEAVPSSTSAGESSPAPEPVGQVTPAAPRAAARADESVSAGESVPDVQPARGLTNDETAFSPTFAAAGSAMFYHAEGADSSAIMRADTDPAGATLRITRVVDDQSQNYHARPSPDGTRIAFDSDRDGVRGVYIAEADGSHVRRVSGEGFAAVPSWSPDGRMLAFVKAETDRPRVWNLWTLDLASGEMQRVTSYRVGQPWGASWFPDGRRLAYSHEDRLVVLERDSGRQRVYPSPRKGRLVRTPAVSPDGRRIIFQVYRDGAWLLDLRDGSMRKVLADPSAEEYAWSPDGRRVAYHSRRSGAWGVWLMTAR